ncbi:hypothetical protein KAI87_10285 [Myxococcota bacterium]|nr:hypothetical protein [Myxococcota bacterium]
MINIQASPSAIKEREHEFTSFVKELENSPSRQINHARRHCADVPYHIVSRIFGGVFRLVPTPKITAIINGIFARARQNYPGIKLYAAVVLSNHFHLQLQGEPEEIPVYIGYIKREISRRIGKEQDRSGPMWAGYDSLALPSQISEMSSFRYILGQGVKEGLVERPEQWPGLHCAKSLLTGKPLPGIWFDGTGFSRKWDREKRRKNGNTDLVKKKDFITKTELSFEKIQRWENLSDEEYAAQIKAIIDEVVQEQKEERGGAPVLGAEQVMKTSIDTHKAWEPLLFHEERSRLVCWGPSHATELQEYLAEYWAFQKAYKEASKRFRAGELDVEFPENSFRPTTFVGMRKGVRKRKAAA